MTLRISVPRVGVLDVFEPDVKNSILINSVLKVGTRISKLDHIFMSQFIYISLVNVHQRALLIERCVLLYEWMSACVNIVISHLVFAILSFSDQVQVYRYTPTSSIRYMIKKKQTSFVERLIISLEVIPWKWWPYWSISKE